MKLFSVHYGYIDPNDVIIREQITEPVLNSILNWWDKLTAAIQSLNHRYIIVKK